MSDRYNQGYPANRGGWPVRDEPHARPSWNESARRRSASPERWPPGRPANREVVYDDRQIRHPRNADHRFPAYEDPRLPPPRRYGEDPAYGGNGGSSWRSAEGHQSSQRDGWERGTPYSYDPPGPAANQYSGSTSSRSHPSEPSRDVIMLGMQEGITEESLLRYLRADLGASVDNVTIVKDKMTGQFKGYGFALFSSLTASRGFMQANFPTLTVPAYGLQPPQTLRIDFAAANKVGSGDGSGFVPPMRDGTRDIGQPVNGNRVLLLRGLGTQTEPEDVCSSVGEQIVRLSASSSAPLQDGKSAIERVLLVRDRHSKSPAGLAFVELASAELAKALLSHLLSREAQPYGFVVDQLPIACSFAAPASFEALDVDDAGRAWAVRGRGDGGIGGEESRWYRYWDDYAGVSEFVVSADPLHALEYLEYLRAAAIEASKPATAAGKGLASSTSGTDQGGLQKGSGQAIKIGFSASLKKKDRDDVMVPLPLTDRASAAPTSASVFGSVEDEDEDPLPLPSKTFPGRGKGAMPNVASSKKALNNISKWTTRQGELKADLEAARRAPPASSVSASNATAPRPKPQAVAAQVIPSSTPAEDSSAAFDYRDLDKKACLLCQRQFKTLDVLGRHCTESELHKKNLLDEAACAAGQSRKQTSSADVNTDQGPSYRDRAAERRQVFHQPAIPIPEGDKTGAGSKRKYADGPAPPPPPPPRVETIHPGEDESNKGNQLLKKMGWSEGTGLGVGGEGRVAPVEAMLFQQGVGLGAAKPKETKDFGRYQGWDGYSKMAKDGARQRYDESGAK